MLHAIDQASELTNRMQSFARQQPQQVKSIELNQLFAHLESFVGQALVKEVDIEYAIPSNLWSCSTDLRQLEQAILNLVINVRDAMPMGKICPIKTRYVVLPNSKDPDQPGLPAGDYVNIVVRDAGERISATNQLQIFDPFFTTKGAGGRFQTWSEHGARVRQAIERLYFGPFGTWRRDYIQHISAPCRQEGRASGCAYAVGAAVSGQERVHIGD